MLLYIDMSKSQHRFADPVIPEALPEYLQKNPQFAGKELLYFYHPEVPTVILGHYQDVYHEVDFPYLKRRKISLVRRNSGGGAVFVDPGDLTYVYIDTASKVKTPKFARYIQPILAALRELGVDAHETGRNDLTVAGRKFSGMSFSQIEDRVLYGGTLMFDVDLEMANRVLTPAKSKLADKGIASVRSRITNLKPLINRAGFTLADLQECILKHIQAANPDFASTCLTNRQWQAVQELGRQKFGTKKWIYGSGLTAYYVDHYFHGIGNVGIGFNLRHHRLADVKIYGDLLALNQDEADRLQDALDGCPLDPLQIRQQMQAHHFDDRLQPGAAAAIADEIVRTASNED